MRELLDQHKVHWSDKEFLKSVILGVLFLLFSLTINYYAGLYATERASNSLGDIILDNIRAFDVDNLYVYGPMVMWVFVAILFLMKPNRIPFAVKSIALFIVIRSIFVIFTHIGASPEEINVNVKSFEAFIFGGGYFFSGHTGLPFLMALVFWKEKILRFIFLASSVFFGVVVLAGHLHYSIDVFAAFFITYTIYRIAEIIFPKDKILFLR